ncbi:hypothetical protein [uncultured Roseobacter sp.]|uniref:hypothetical protein n=1 Tax=uncultured Roseobacter sp. TaxID=114847 RepID=UPI0026081902|nr:hypothetical protein [uncultured Roseobacter sp.]
MFGILSHTLKTATRQDVWGHRGALPEQTGLMSEVERRTTGARGRWKAPQSWVRRGR